MIPRDNYRTGWVCAIAMSIVVCLALSACDGNGHGNRAENPDRLPLAEIKTAAEFRRIMAEKGERLLVFDFYADWCLPCKELEPILEAVAWQKRASADVFKINYDENAALAELMGVRGIPFVSFVKNRTLVYSLLGLRPKKTYLEAIDSFTRSVGPAETESTGGGIPLDLSGLPPSQAPE